MNRAAVVAISLILILAGVAGRSAFGQQERDGRQVGQTAPSTGDASVTQGEVRKVDKDAKKLTIRHGPIRNLDMPGMTMVFQVKDPAMLEKVKAGDRIGFVVENVGGALTVVRIDVTR